MAAEGQNLNLTLRREEPKNVYVLRDYEAVAGKQ